MMIDSYQAVIFDLDGVLAYTEPANFRILKHLVAGFGIDLSEEDNRALLGLDYADTAAYINRHYDLPVTPDRLVDLLLEAILECIESELEPAPGGQDLVKSLAQSGMLLGVASNSPSEYVRRILHGLGLSAYLPVPVGRDDVARGKPFPDPYLEACRRAGADPARSLAIEDSPVGAQAALSAGMTCIMIAGELPAGFAGRVSLAPDLPSLHKSFLAR